MTPANDFSPCVLIGTEAQVEWAERIKDQVSTEFDRVENAFLEISRRQSPLDQQDTVAIVAIVRRYRGQVLENTMAGYFIRNWQETGSQIRDMLAADVDYRAIQHARKKRSVPKTHGPGLNSRHYLGAQ